GAAASRPLLDRLDQRLWTVPEHPAVQVDHEQRRPLAEARVRAAIALQVLLVLLGEKLIPNSLGHALLLSPCRDEDGSSLSTRRLPVNIALSCDLFTLVSSSPF